ncbi:transposase for insertion sequence element IS200 [Salmonella enterica subsp. enterica serovar Typhi]|nr:transposase for insertion sequence element IS200 [Salmonella enterica subsp. enterica serovar Typhi]
MGDEKSLAHTRWNCKYHIVFAPKYRRQAFYGEKRRAVGSILRKLCEWKNVRILEANSGREIFTVFSIVVINGNIACSYSDTILIKYCSSIIH